MSKQTNGAEVQGTVPPLMSPDSVKELLQRDLAVLSNFIRMLQDPDVTAYLADYLSDRYHATKPKE